MSVNGGRKDLQAPELALNKMPNLGTDLIDSIPCNLQAICNLEQFCRPCMRDMIPLATIPHSAVKLLHLSLEID